MREINQSLPAAAVSQPPCEEPFQWIVMHENERSPEWFATEQEAIDAAQEITDGYLSDGEWGDGAASVVVARITHRAKEQKIDPPDCYDEDYPAPYDYYCEYKVLPISQGSPDGETPQAKGDY